MSRLEWNEREGELLFETEQLRGTVRADGRRQAVTELVYTPSGLRVDAGTMLALYRLLARSAWLGEARAMAHTATPTADGIDVVWEPTLAHQAQLTARFAIREPAHIDCTVEVVGHAFYPDYEVFVSAYFANGFRSGAYTAAIEGATERSPVQVRPTANPVYQEMYVAFPRDERAAHVIADGRWQRGRHFTRFLSARYYGLPFGFYGRDDGPLDALLLGLPGDVFAVSMAYATDNPQDSVGRHNSLYLSLFGRDLHPGERWRTVVRLAVGEFAQDQRRHAAQYEAFLADHRAATGVLPVELPVHS